MQKINVFDSSGNALINLVQWDIDVNVYIQQKDITKAYDVHFFNTNCDEALVVASSYSDNKLKVKIPNLLLTQAMPIVGYVYVTKGDESKSLYGFQITVKKRPQPSDYVFSDTKDYINLQEILEDCKDWAERSEGFANSASASALSAAQNANTAVQKANAASASEANAATSANTATQKASAAAASAETAQAAAQSANLSAEVAQAVIDQTLDFSFFINENGGLSVKILKEDYQNADII